MSDTNRVQCSSVSPNGRRCRRDYDNGFHNQHDAWVDEDTKTIEAWHEDMPRFGELSASPTTESPVSGTTPAAPASQKMTEAHADVIDVALSEARSYQNRYESAANENTDPDDAEENRGIASHYRVMATRLAEVQSFIRDLRSGSLSTYDTRTEVKVPLERFCIMANRVEMRGDVSTAGVMREWLADNGFDPRAEIDPLAGSPRIEGERKC